LSSVASRTRTHLSAEKVENLFPYCRNTKAGNQINSPIKQISNIDISNDLLIQHLSEIHYLDQQETVRCIWAADKKYFTEFKPSSVPQVSAGQRKRVKDKGTKLGNDNNSRPGSCTMTPDKSTNQRSTGTPPAVLDQNSVSQLSSLGPCAEAERWVDKSINGFKRNSHKRKAKPNDND